MAAQPTLAQRGYKEVLHTVVKGESLSGIAAHYRALGWPLKDWKPIYNITRERTGLWNTKGTAKQKDNPDLIHPGELLIIPRSPYGYDARIQQIQTLIRQLQSSASEVAAVKKEAEHFSEKLNLIGDVATFFVNSALKATKAVKAAATAKKLTGLAAKKALEERNSLALDRGLGITEFTLKRTGHEHAAKVVKGISIAKSGHELHSLPTLLKKAGDGFGVVADVLDLVFDWTEPATVSKFFLKVFTGQDLDATLKEQARLEALQKAQVIMSLEKRMAALRHERELVYRVDKQGN